MSAVFELDKKQIRQSFARASKSYDRLAELQCRVGTKLLTGMTSNNLQGNVLDLGCGTGFVSGELLKLCPDQRVIALDIAVPMLQAARNKNTQNQLMRYLCADADSLPFKKQSIDTLVSNLALQWCKDLPAVCFDVRQILRPGGEFIWSTFGPQTLHELKEAWIQVDEYTHVNKFYGVEEIGEFMHSAGFKNVHIKSRNYISHYDQVLDLMKELKGLGAHNRNHGRNHSITGKQKFQNVIDVYEQQRTLNRIPATFEVIFIAAQR